MKRQHLIVLIFATLALCWLWMQIVHELGHVLGAAITGGHVERVFLHPFEISRTELGSNPHPLIVTWMGPLVGIALPSIALMTAKWHKWRYGYLVQFFAGFCLIANGLYLGIASFPAIGDAGDMLRLGTPIWVLWLFGVVTTAAGFWLWHALGPALGLQVARKSAEPGTAYIVSSLLVATILLELVCY